MSIRYCPLGSGSSGNSFWVSGGGVELLVDCGLSARQLEERLVGVGGALERIDAIVCTHGHRDHILGTEILACRRGKPLWVTHQTCEFLSRKIPHELIHCLNPDGPTRIGGLSVTATPTQHDIPGSVALMLSDGEVSLGVATDLGRVTPRVVDALKSLDALILEMNHDEEMLARGPYPNHLKRRILSDYGHLSNAQAAGLLDHILHPGLTQIALAHLSEKNNTPALALAMAEAALRRHGSRAELIVCEQSRVGTPREIRRRDGCSAAPLAEAAC